MHIEIDTERLNRADGLALAIMIHATFPEILTQVSLMTTTAHRALQPTVDPQDAFGGEGAPPSVAPSAEEAFAGPQSEGASAATGQAGDGAGSLAGGTGGVSISTTATNGASPSSVTLDADGLPWDARIHSGGKSLTQAGKWRARVGVGKDTVAAVQAELRAALAAGGGVPLAPAPMASNAAPDAGTVATVPAPPAASVAPSVPAPPASAPDTSTIAPDASTATSPAVAPANPPFPPEVAAQALAAAATGTGQFSVAGGQSSAAAFANVMRYVADGKFTADEMSAACTAVGITSPRELMAKPNLNEDFVQTLNDLRAGG